MAVPGADHPWRQYRTRPTRRETQVAEIMAECDCGGPGCRPRKATAKEIAARLGLKPEQVAFQQARIRKRLGWQAR